MNCIRTLFERKYDFVGHYPTFGEDTERTHELDKDIAASGFSKDRAEEFDKVCVRTNTEPVFVDAFS